MAHSTRGLWHLVIEQWRNEFSKRGCSAPPTVVSERAFRNAFQDLCRSRKEYSYTPLLVRLQFTTISAVARTIDSTCEYEPPFSLASLVFGACFVSVQYGSSSDLGLAGTAELLGRLNEAVPPLFTEIKNFAEDSRGSGLHETVRELVNIYMACMFSVIDCLIRDSTFYSSTQKADIEAIVHESATAIRSLEGNFEQILEQSWSACSNPPASTRHFHSSQTEFLYVRFLGRGSFGEVHEVRESSTGEVYAKKIIYLNKQGHSSGDPAQNAETEFDTMKRLTHDHIVRVLLPQKEADSFNFLMLPVADQDLRVFLERCVKDQYPPHALSSILQWFGCLLHALAFAHRCSIIHQDIKPSNILVKDEGGQLHIYLADFGMAKDFSNRNGSATLNEIVRGTPVYRAPEVRPHQPRGRAADMFSLGCVFSEMFTIYCRRSLEEYQDFRRAHQSAENQLAFRDNLAKVQLWLRDLALAQDENADLGNVLQPLCHQMMREDPAKRLTTSKAIQMLRNNDNPGEFFCTKCGPI